MKRVAWFEGHDESLAVIPCKGERRGLLNWCLDPSVADIIYISAAWLSDAGREKAQCKAKGAETVSAVDLRWQCRKLD